MPDTAPVFIVGVQRSGTTLLRLILNAHPDIAIPEEARFFTPLLKRSHIRRTMEGKNLERLVSYLRSNEQFRLWNFDREPFLRDLADRPSVTLAEVMDTMFSSYAVSEGKSRWGDKSLFFGSLELLHDMFPNARFIHIVRDGRDVFNSWRKMDPSKGHPAVMSLDWRYKLASIENSVKRIPEKNVMTLRYEDLLAQPEETVKSICSFLDIKFETAMLEFHKTSQHYIGDHHSELIFKAIDNSNISKWRKNLSPDEIKIYELMAKGPLNKYGYELSQGGTSLKQISLAIGDITVGLPLRAWQVVSARLDYKRALNKGKSTKSIRVGQPPKGTR